MMQQFTCSVRSFVRPFIHTYMASKVRNRHCVTICVHCHSPVRLHCIVFRVNLLGFGSIFLIRALFCELFYWRWLHFDRSHMPFFGGLIFVSPGQLDYPADLSTHSHTCIQINFILYLSWLCYAVKLWYQKNSKMQSTTLMMLRIEKKRCRTNWKRGTGKGAHGDEPANSPKPTGYYGRWLFELNGRGKKRIHLTVMACCFGGLWEKLYQGIR